MSEEREAHLTFLEETASYFINRSTGGEDRAHWANVYNAENCRKIASEIQRLRGEVERLRGMVSSYACECDPGKCETGHTDDTICGLRARALLANLEREG